MLGKTKIDDATAKCLKKLAFIVKIENGHIYATHLECSELSQRGMVLYSLARNISSRIETSAGETFSVSFKDSQGTFSKNEDDFEEICTIAADILNENPTVIAVVFGDSRLLTFVKEVEMPKKASIFVTAIKNLGDYISAGNNGTIGFSITDLCFSIY